MLEDIPPGVQAQIDQGVATTRDQLEELLDTVRESGAGLNKTDATVLLGLSFVKICSEGTYEMQAAFARMMAVAVMRIVDPDVEITL